MRLYPGALNLYIYNKYNLAATRYNLATTRYPCVYTASNVDEQATFE